MAATLFITRGLPASGKTTWARERLANAPLGTMIRLNRDDLRRMSLPAGYAEPEHDAEQAINTVRDTALRALLAQGCDVIVDDTNLRARHVRSLMDIAERASAIVEIIDFTDVPLQECLRRDTLRPALERVGERVIRSMHARYLAQPHGKPSPVPPPGLAGAVLTAEPYVPRPGAPLAILVDVDGTVALLRRNPYDESRVSTDLPSAPVIETVAALVTRGHRAVFMSGRTEGCREDTTDWLAAHVSRGEFDIELHMRAVGDHRPDRVVKLELFNEHVRQRYDVRVVLDDRNSVVELWRSMGLTCLQVAPGDF
ncbi:MAG TPA: AAA family ATPase [Pseudonocardiaceae bacterium]|nr:AAA family ATPase [Pseudonocardiaceae bacterium]